MAFLELIPITTMLTLLTEQIIETASAAYDVMVEKESFRLLHTFFMDIQPVLNELKKRNISESAAARKALESLQDDVRKARSLVDNCKNKSKFYQLLHCRNIVRQAEQISRDIAKSLNLLSLASTEVAVDIRDNVDKLRQDMLNAEFRTSDQKLRIIEKVQMGLEQQENDRAFVNDLINDIARAVGIPVEDSEIRKELESLKKEKEDASIRKAREEEVYMEQILALLSTADAAHPPGSSREDLIRRRNDVLLEDEIPVWRSFLCPISNELMKDPVTISTGRTFERKNIQDWFDQGERTDPVSKEPVHDLSLRPNNRLKKAIEEWVEENNGICIRNARRKLAREDKSMIIQALEDLCSLSDKSSQLRQTIRDENVIPLIVTKMKHGAKEVRKKCLDTLQVIVPGNNDNKERLVTADGVKLIVKFVASDDLSKRALLLLLALLLDGTPDNPVKDHSVYRKIIDATGSIIVLVTALNKEDAEVSRIARQILEQLCDTDQNIIEMAKAQWFTPLIKSLHQGSDDSKLLMAKSLADMALTDLNKQYLGENGAVTSLVGMMSGNLEAKGTALKAIENICSLRKNKIFLAETGGVPIVIEILSSGRYPLMMRESAAVILAKTLEDDGSDYLVDGNRNPIDLSTTIKSLLVIQENSSNTQSIREYVLLSLFRLVSPPDAIEARRLLIESDGIPTLAPLLECSDTKIRGVIVQLLSCLSDDCPKEISRFLVQRNLGSIFASLIQNNVRGDVQAAAARILASLPADDINLTSYLTQEGILQAIMNLLSDGNAKAKEGAIGTVIRFTFPSNKVLQQKVVELGIFPILRSLLNSGTQLSKQRAATVLANLSVSTLHLSTRPSVSGCFFFKKNQPGACKVHLGPCKEKTTFCLIESNVIPDIVLLLNAHESDAAGAAVDALFTLVCEDSILQKGAMYLHEENAITPILRQLSHGTDATKEKAIQILERIFKLKKMKDLYGGHARIALVDLATNGNNSIRKQAARILAILEAIHEASSYF